MSVQPSVIDRNPAQASARQRTGSGPTSPQPPLTARSPLALAASFGPEALELFAKREQSKRDATARRDWRGYRLVRIEGYEFWQVIQTPSGARYACETTSEGVKRFVARAEWNAVHCPDQSRVDEVNAALRGARVAFRVETKHALIAALREEASRRGEIGWQEVKGAGGVATAPLVAVTGSPAATVDTRHCGAYACTTCRKGDFD